MQEKNVIGGASYPKLLEVYEAVVKFGPIPLDELYPKLNHSRSSTFRSLKHLQAAGWVRTLMSKHDFVATSHLEELISSGSISMPEADLVCNLLRECVKSWGMHIDVGLYITNRTFFLVESSNKSVQVNSPYYPCNNTTALIACCCLENIPPDQFLFDPHQSTSLIDIKQTHDVLKLCKYEISQKGYYFSPDEVTASTGVTFDSGVVGGVTIYPKTYGPTHFNKLLKCVDDVLKILKKAEISAK